jgi:eukaryotic-like serine/threonine-protein kinase
MMNRCSSVERAPQSRVGYREPADDEGTPQAHAYPSTRASSPSREVCRVEEHERIVVPAPGSLIDGKYRVIGPIGAGGMGVVVEAVHVALGHRVAVKLVKGIGDNQRAMARFLHEARVAAQLPGEHICRATDVGRSSFGPPFLVMELLTGRDLQAELDARRRLPAREAVDLILQAGEGVAEAHAVGLVHRDIKPANLFLARRRDGSRLVKVLDFGISKWALGTGSDPGTPSCSTAGTPAYMAPEQFEIDVKVDARCDQHALAVVLYEMLVGAPPFMAPRAYSLALIIARDPPRLLRDIDPAVPAGLEAAILRALSKDPAARFVDLAAFAEALAPHGGEGARASARNIGAIIEAAAALRVVTVRRSTPGSAAEPRARRVFPPSARGDAALEPTVLGDDPWADSARGVDPLHVDRERGRASRRHARLLNLSALGVAIAAVALTGVLLDERDRPEAARDSSLATSMSRRAALSLGPTRGETHLAAPPADPVACPSPAGDGGVVPAGEPPLGVAADGAARVAPKAITAPAFASPPPRGAPRTATASRPALPRATPSPRPARARSNEDPAPKERGALPALEAPSAPESAGVSGARAPSASPRKVFGAHR